MYLGIDIGSTTIKAVLLDEKQCVQYKTYERHYSKTRDKLLEILETVREKVQKQSVHVCITGSAGLELSKSCEVPYAQEVFATTLAVETFEPNTDVVVELGGEDAKIIFLTGGMEERMNGSCAGGTGAFIDQMAVLLNVTVEELDQLSFMAEKNYTIASRCGVFAKSDIQPLINQGAKIEDISSSIYNAVVEQTIIGLALGREIIGNVLFLGGPLTFLMGLRESFKKRLQLTEKTASFPEDAQYFVAKGAAIFSKEVEPLCISELILNVKEHKKNSTISNRLEPLFQEEQEYRDFKERHAKASVRRKEISEYVGNAYLGVDAGSTTTKLVLLSEDAEILYEYYTSNQGNPVGIIRTQLQRIYELLGDNITIASSAVTGYGENLLKNAFSIDFGLVETVAHYKAAQYFDNTVDFIIDIGGQDIKCFKFKGNALDSIMLNEACSSGCGSFIETFAKAWGKSSHEFAQLALYSKQPVNLGSRCTVFMNSSVKQAQNEGADISDISAGLSISVVKNAIYKVIRANSPEELGTNIVVQGGTFYNDAVLRSFEMEIGRNVKRPEIAGLMGAFGAALYAKENGADESALISNRELTHFTHKVSNVTCRLCTNFCQLTLNHFGNGRRFIAGNKCDKPNNKRKDLALPNLMEYKLEKLLGYQQNEGTRGCIGLPLVLNMYENLPFWYTFFTSLGFSVCHSGKSDRALFVKGQHTIPSDTVCYPAKLVHGHIERLLDMNVDIIFYPCLTYNFDEKTGDNHYNCPVVAYYPELIASNVKRISDVIYHQSHYSLHVPKNFIKQIYDFLAQFEVTQKEIKKASDLAYAAQKEYLRDLRNKGEEVLEYAKEKSLKVVVLAGRPYHIDPEVNHGIDKLLNSLGFAVITEDSISHLVQMERLQVISQWTYHSRLFNAAKYVSMNENMELVQLVSFGCGVDAIISDEVDRILTEKNKLYTQIKIDEISNLGAVKIRLRSLVAAMEFRENDDERESTVYKGK